MVDLLGWCCKKASTECTDQTLRKDSDKEAEKEDEAVTIPAEFAIFRRIFCEGDVRKGISSY